ncbi:MAG: dihydrofolate reductase [Clostridia bacterium]|nr:dihydrofolate reductase [Clostridia bacterium]
MISIVAVDQNWGIGYKNKLPWRIPGELAFFKKTTIGNTVIMGRKTLESLPGRKPLSNRRNIVLSRDTTRSELGVEFVSTIDDLFAITNDETVFVIGGEQIYRLLLPYCSKSYVTKVDGIYETDTFFPNLDMEDNWEVESSFDAVISENGIKYQIFIYRNTAIKYI